MLTSNSLNHRRDDTRTTIFPKDFLVDNPEGKTFWGKLKIIKNLNKAKIIELTYRQRS